MMSLGPSILFAVILGMLGLAGAETQRTCRVLFLNGPDDGLETLHLFDGLEFREIDLPRMNFSQVYALPAGPITLKLFKDRPGDPKRLPAGAPSVQLGEDLRDVYLLLFSDPKNKVAPVRVEAVNANEDRIKAGQMLWFNLTDKTIGGTVGSERLRLEPKRRLLMKAPATKAGDYTVDLGYLRKGDERVYPLCETKWRHDPSSRSAAFVMPPSRGRTPRILVFPDYREPTDER